VIFRYRISRFRPPLLERKFQSRNDSTPWQIWRRSAWCNAKSRRSCAFALNRKDLSSLTRRGPAKPRTGQASAFDVPGRGGGLGWTSRTDARWPGIQRARNSSVPAVRHLGYFLWKTATEDRFPGSPETADRSNTVIDQEKPGREVESAAAGDSQTGFNGRGRSPGPGAATGARLDPERGFTRSWGEEVAGELGLEPRTTVPKTAVLPLHHSPAGTAKPRGVRRGGGDSAGVGRMQRCFADLFRCHFSFCGAFFVACRSVAPPL
jgi:hypothetical protein